VWSRDFLRDPNDFPDRVDERYLVNQSSAARFFLHWFLGEQALPYDEMLRTMHRIAACSPKGGNYYRVPTLKGQFLEPIQASTDEKILYDSPVSGCMRETHPGRMRSDLEAKNIAHPTVDVIEMTSHELTLLCNAEAKIPHASTDSDKCCVSKRIRSSLSALVDKHSAKPPAKKLRDKPEQVCKAHYSLALYEYLARLPVCRIKKHQFARCAPVGKRREDLIIHCSELISRCTYFYRRMDISNMLRMLFAYYHTAINLMPFANINNSLFMCQVNALLRWLDIQTLPHGKLDQYALICSYKPFLRVLVVLHPLLNAGPGADKHANSNGKVQTLSRIA